MKGKKKLASAKKQNPIGRQLKEWNSKSNNRKLESVFGAYIENDIRCGIRKV